MPDNSITIRAAVPSDVETITDFNIALCRETEGRELERSTVIEGVRRFVGEPARGKYFVAEIDSEVVAQTAYTFEWSDWRNGEIWWIQSVYVLPAHRGQGLFRKLFSHIRELAEQDRECCGLRLYMERENHAARETYVRLGFADPHYQVFELLLGHKGS